MRIKKLSFLFLSILMSACGGSKSNPAPAPAKGKVETQFQLAANKNQIPLRLLMAVGYLESHLNPQESFAIYNEGTENQAIKSLARGETAFGISLHELELTETRAYSLEEQIAAYSSWLSKKLSESGVTLTSQFNTPETQFAWLWEIAKLHREASLGRRNLPILFAMELIDILNQGFVWQSLETKEMIQFNKESPTIKIENFPLDAQKLFAFDVSPSDLVRARYFSLSNIAISNEKNHPKRIEVIHCPFNLSLCLDLQGSSDVVALDAHYVIPRNFSFDNIDSPLQLARHDHAVNLINHNGKNTPVTDAVVIMLTGDSGRNVGSIREQANPLWYTDEQLRVLGKMVNDICHYMSIKNDINVENCIKIGNENEGVHFNLQSPREGYLWGQIPDFESKVFKSYIENPSGLLGETSIVFPAKKEIYKAGEEIKIQAFFQLQVKAIEAEHLMRCENGLVVWTPFSYEQIRGKTDHILATRLWDSGPNANGSHFIRIKVYGGESGDLLGWASTSLNLTNFEPEMALASPRECLDNQ